MGFWDIFKKDNKSDYDILVSKMNVWKKKYLIQDNARTFARQESILNLILKNPHHDLYKMDAHGATCAFCAAREGRVYSRSGKDPDFPPLALAFQKIDKNGPNVLWNTYLIPHPGCTHSFCAWTPMGRSDAELSEIKRFSNIRLNPLTHDPRTLKQCEAYELKGRSNSVEKAAASYMVSQVSRMMAESVSVNTYSVDQSESVATPRGAEISYLDAEALKFWDNRRTDFEIPNYYSNSAFGRNVGPALKRLVKAGYLEVSDMEKSIKLKTVPELKAILAEHELKISGNKPELVHRLMDNLSYQELEVLFPVGVYEITPKGKRALEPYSIIFTSTKLGMGFPYYRLMKEKEAAPAEEDVEIILRMMRQDLSKAQKEGDHEAYRVRAMETARLLNGLARTEEAMEYYCVSFFLFWHRNTFDLKANSIFAYEYDAKRIDECGKVCGYSLEQTLNVFQTALRKHNPFSLCTGRNIAAAQQVFKKALSV